MSQERVALRAGWGETAIIDPTALLDEASGQDEVFSVPRAIAEEYIATERRLRELGEQVRQCPRYRTVPARKLMLGDDTVAEKTLEFAR